ncbi:MAG: branched-chain amino acid ABC transporter permease [Elainella sp. Prado103]|nr:branched-chain amino acid ABC transporter permease [Elainella sp. Prado103]
MLTSILDGIFNGLSVGSVLLLAALGLAIVFGLMGVINMAHGELMMLGAYTTFVVQNGFKQLGETWLPFYIFFAVIAAFIVAALVGLALERGVIRFLYGRPLETLLATWGVSLILQQFVRSVNWVLIAGLIGFCLLFFGGLWLLQKRVDLSRIPQWTIDISLLIGTIVAFALGFSGVGIGLLLLEGFWRLQCYARIENMQNWVIVVLLLLSGGIAGGIGALMSQTYGLAVTKPWFGAQNVDVTAPKWLLGGLPIGNYQLPYTRMFIMVLTVLCVLGIYFFLNRTPWGLRIRSVTQNRNMSACLGIPTQKVDALTFALGSGLAGIAGCAVSLLGSVGPNTGQNYIVNTFMVVVVGGVGKLVGTIVGAMVIGITDYIVGTGILALLFTPVKPLADFFTFFATTSMAKVMVFFLIVVFLQFRPAGLFPQKGRTVDA